LKEYKTYRESLESQGVTLINYEHWFMSQRIVESFHTHPKFKNILKDGIAEQAIYARDPETGLILKIKPDFCFDDVIMDIKSTTDADEDEFSRTIATWDYHCQNAMYRYVFKLAKGVYPVFIWGACEKVPPYECRPFILSEEHADLGMKLFRHRLNKLATAIDSGCFNGYSDKIKEIGLPYWYVRNFESYLT
jgi:hypothetical protein